MPDYKPSLSEMSAVYNRPAPSQQTNELMGQGMSNLGQGIQNARDMARKNRPVTAWEKAIMRLMAGHDPKVVANDTRRELAMTPDDSAAPTQSNGTPGYTIQQPQPAAPQQAPVQNLGQNPPAQGYSASPTGRPVYTGPLPTQQGAPVGISSATGPQVDAMFARQPLPAARQFAADRNPPMPPTNQSMSMSGPAAQGGGLSDAEFNNMTQGMTHQDYEDYVAGMHGAGQMKVSKSQADLMELEKEKTRRALAVEDKKGSTKLQVARMELDKEGIKQDREDVRAELDRRIKKGLLDEKVADDIADNQLGWAKLQEAKRNFMMAHSQAERLKYAEIMYRHADNLASSSAKVDSSLFGRAGAANADIKSTINDQLKEAQETRDAADQFMKEYRANGGKAPDESTSVSGGNTELKPRGGGGPRGGGQKGATRTYKKKGSNVTIDATPQQFQEAVAAGKIEADEWE